MDGRRFLLDTNILSDVVRRPRGEVARRMRDESEDSICTSIIVAAELRYGAAERAAPRLSAQLEMILDVLEILPFEPPADAIYGSVRADLERRGQLIGPNDLLIAAQALALGHILVTDNVGEFSRVQGLAVENWRHRH